MSENQGNTGPTQSPVDDAGDDRLLGADTAGGRKAQEQVESADDDVDMDPADEEMAFLLATGFTHATISKVVGVSTKTIQRRLKNERFRNRVMEFRRERLAATTAQLIGLSDSALEALKETLDSENEGYRLRAAQVVLSMGRRHHAEEATEWELSARMAAVERKVEIALGEGA